MLKTPKVYIAGPDIFSLQWPSISMYILKKCEDLGLTPIFPFMPNSTMDQPNAPGVSTMGSLDDARQIRAHCLSLLRDCDGVIANITPFRGDEPDSGTVAEIILANEWGKPVIAYTHNPKMTHERHPLGRKTEHGSLLCKDDYLVEQFNLPCNIMVVEACKGIIVGDAIDALTIMKGVLTKKVFERHEGMPQIWIDEAQ